MNDTAPEYTRNLILNMALRSGSSRVEPIHVYEAMAFRTTHGRQGDHVSRMTTSVDLLRVVAGLDTLDDGKPVEVDLLPVCAVLASGTTGEMAAVASALADTFDDMNEAAATAAGLRRWTVSYPTAGEQKHRTAFASSPERAVVALALDIVEACGIEDGTISALVDDPHTDPEQPLCHEFAIAIEAGVLINVTPGSTFVLEPHTFGEG